LAGTAGGALGHIVDLADGIRVLGVPIAGMARFQTFPDSCQWPALKSLASSVCGNAVPPLMAREIIKSVLIGGKL
jgi:DNA (cytosine-5)-methyltransferase 1